jgi:ADP-ribosylglycohydrolase
LRQTGLVLSKTEFLQQPGFGTGPAFAKKRRSFMYAKWMTLSETVLVELAQCADEGRDVRAFEEDARIIADCFNEGQIREEDAKKLIDKMRSAPIEKGYPYIEPDRLADIREARPASRVCGESKINWDAYYDKVYGAWLGRCAGCLLGQPIEGWHSDRITGLLKAAGNYPVKYYIASNIDQAIRDKYQVVDARPGTTAMAHWINNVSCAPSDDDTNYTTLYLKILEETGRGFTSANLADYWLRLMPIYITCTAERVAYRNMVGLILPPLSGSYYNAYREWIGAQIRADFFGYVNPGNSEKAAEYAWRDGRLSHVKNGIYGEMFAAAMIARAAVSSNMIDIVKAGIGEIPQKSRLAEGLERVLAWRGENIGWEDALERLRLIWNEKNNHQWCHVISNAMVCAIALLWGDNDFAKTMGISICAGFDTDCNAATAGSVLGMALGAKELPEPWIKALNDTLVSGISGMAKTAISELAERTLNLARKE